MQPTSNTVLITGGTSGIGRALAEHFHERGNRVITGRRQEKLDEITAARPGMHGVLLDVLGPHAARAFTSRIREQFPELNVLVNNAGIFRPEDLTTDPIDLSVSRAIIDTNILGVLEITAGDCSPCSDGNRAPPSSRPPPAWHSSPGPRSRPTAPARPFSTPGCNRSAFSFAGPWRSSSWCRPTCKQS